MLETFWFEMAERPGYLLDISISKDDDEPFTPMEAKLAARRLYYNVAEETRGKMICLIEIYDDSSTSVSYRDLEGPALENFSDYRWTRRRLEEALHGGYSKFTILPRWMIDVNSFFLYCLTRVMQVWDAVFNLDRGKHLRREAGELGSEETFVHDNDDEAESSMDNVVPFPGRSHD